MATRKSVTPMGNVSPNKEDYATPILINTEHLTIEVTGLKLM